MQQLLDADEDDHKGFAWWKWGGLFALLLIPTSIYFMNGSFSNQSTSQSSFINFSSNDVTPSTVKNEKIESSEIETVNAQANTSSANKNQASANTRTKNSIDANNENQLIEKASSSSSFKKNNSTLNNHKSVNLNSKEKTDQSKSSFSNPSFSRPRAYNSSQLNTSKIPKTDVGQEIEVLEQSSKLIVDSEQTLIADVSLIEHLGTSSFDVADRELPTLSYAPYNKVYPKVRNNPWYLVTSVGAKYPIVDVSNASVGALIPTQKLFPSYLAEVGVGKHFGKLSFEGGLTTSLYQYKLGQNISADADFNAYMFEVDSYTESNSGRVVSSESENYVVNKFAVLTPYVRGQYSFNLKKNFVLGLHALFGVNRKINIENQTVNSEIATIDPAQANFNESIQDVINGKSTNFNYELGFSIEKLFEKRGKVALDFSYGFATGLLEAGAYTVSREAQTQVPEAINGSYTLNGAGPKVKFRYYLNSKG